MPVILVVNVIAGVVVAVATLPAKPLADTTETLVTVPDKPVSTPPDRVKPPAILISSAAPVNAVVLPSNLDVAIVRPLLEA